MWKGDWEEERKGFGDGEPELGRGGVRLGVPGEKSEDLRRPKPLYAGPHSALCVPSCPQNFDIVLVHYLNVPALEDCGKGCSPIFVPSADRRVAKWSRGGALGTAEAHVWAAGRDRAPRGEWT